MSRKLMGKKRGMTQIFDDKGQAVPCTVIEIEPNVVTQIKTKEIDGYEAVQFGFEKLETKDPRTISKRVSKPLLGHFKKSGTQACRYLSEVRVDNVESFSLGQELKADLFNNEPYVDVTAISKGKGFQGVIKKHHFAGGPASHGSGFHRHAGSTGMRSTPGRCLPGGKKASQMGLERKTVENIQVIKIQDNLLIVKGQVPGPRNGLVYVTPAKKKISQAKKVKKK